MLFIKCRRGNANRIRANWKFTSQNDAVYFICIKGPVQHRSQWWIYDIYVNVPYTVRLFRH